MFRNLLLQTVAKTIQLERKLRTLNKLNFSLPCENEFTPQTRPSNCNGKVPRSLKNPIDVESFQFLLQNSKNAAYSILGNNPIHVGVVMVQLTVVVVVLGI